jgi:signal transduction histidine kinase
VVPSGSDQNQDLPVSAGRRGSPLVLLERLVTPGRRRAAGPLDRPAGRPSRTRSRGGQGGDRDRERPRFAWLLPWLATGLLALVLLPLNAGLAATQFGVPPVVAIGVALGQSAALVGILARPWVATALQFLAVTVLAIALQADSGSTWPLTITGMLTLVAHVGLVTARAGRRAGFTTWWAGALLLALLVLLDPRERPSSEWLAIVIVHPVLSAVVLGAVVAARRGIELRQELTTARRDVRVQQTQRAVAEERTRIARELHDVVAHNMSVIHMQATSASYRLHDLTPEAMAEFARIADGARSTMDEMRRVLAVLRDETRDADLTPVPDLGQLPALVESAGRAGVPVELRESAALRAAVLPESVALAAYRIVQESLSNVIRHAPGAPTRISLELQAHDLVVSVVNDAAARAAGPIAASGGAGLGLTGMRERARLVGGSLESGPRDDRGYQVVARLPIGGPE